MIAKIQQQQQNGLINRSHKIDEVTLHQKEALEKKLSSWKNLVFLILNTLHIIFSSGAYEKQMRTLTNENDGLKQHAHQIDRTMAQLKKENEELQQKVIER